MKREIKFRAWHNEANKMLYPENNRQDYVFGWLNEGQPIDIMQFTGLKDKNSKEIYEGDILEWTVNGVNFQRKEHSTIVWKIYEEKEHSSDGFGVTLFSGVNALLIWAEHRGFEVIGNIYENPELLKV